MKKNKLGQVLSGIVLIVLGVLVAIYQLKTVDIYFGIVACAAGVTILGYTFYIVSRNQKVLPSSFVLGSILLAVGITLFTDWLSFAVLVNLLVIVVLGVGVGLLFFGVHLLSHKETFSGFLNVIIGVVSVVLAILYIAVPGSRDIFWLIAGCVIAAYGLLEVVFALIDKK